jgi:hypothetical protein
MTSNEKKTQQPLDKKVQKTLDRYSGQRIDFQLPNEEPPSKKLAGMKPFHPDLPQIPFFVGCIGPRHSGKSVALFNLLSENEGMYGASFKKDNIIFYSQTNEKDPTMKQLNFKGKYGPPTKLGWLVNDIKNKQKAYNEANNMTGVLLVIDDATQLREAWPVIEELSFTGRHDHIHVIYVAHKMSSIPRSVRTQTQQWILFEPHEHSERGWLLDMFSRPKTRVVWDNALRRSWNKKPHNFVYIDYEEKEINRKYRSYFHDPLFTDEELMIISGKAPLTVREEENLQRLKSTMDQTSLAETVGESSKVGVSEPIVDEEDNLSESEESSEDSGSESSDSSRKHVLKKRKII